MLREILKEKTFSAHQLTESTVIRRIKKIETEQDYADVLKCFYAYFNSLEKEIHKFVDESVLSDLNERRNSNYIKEDIETLEADISGLTAVSTPSIQTTAEALCALYVLEGSIMGGPYIVKMLEKRGMDRAFSFFNGYGANSGKMFASFVEVLNAYSDQITEERAIQVTNETFHKFGEVFLTNIAHSQ